MHPGSTPEPGALSWIPEGDPWQCSALCRELCPCVWGINASPIHPCSSSSLLFLTGDLCNHPLISACLPKAEQTLPWGSSPPALLSYHLPGITFSSLTISLLLQALPDPVLPSQVGFCSDTPRDCSGEGNATLPCVLHTSTFPCFGSSNPPGGSQTAGAGYLSLCL